MGLGAFLAIGDRYFSTPIETCGKFAVVKSTETKLRISIRYQIIDLRSKQLFWTSDRAVSVAMCPTPIYSPNAVTMVINYLGGYN